MFVFFISYLRKVMCSNSKRKMELFKMLYLNKQMPGMDRVVGVERLLYNVWWWLQKED